MEDLKEKIRKKIAEKHPEAQINFEPMELTEKIIGQGSMTPIEIKVGSSESETGGISRKKNRGKAEKQRFPARRPHCRATSISDVTDQRRPKSRCAVRTDDAGCDTQSCDRYLFNPLHRQEPLGRPKIRTCLSDTGPDSRKYNEL